MPGYSSELFVNKIDENFICPICHEVFKEPVTCKNGHTFCNDCIQQWLQNSNTCPLDNTMISEGSLTRNLALKGVIDNLEVRCSLSASTGQLSRCIWKGMLHQLQIHRHTCPFQQVHCPNENCKEMIVRRELANHDNLCRFKMVKCKECKVVMMRQDVDRHVKENCPERLLPCPNKCLENVKRKDVVHHLTHVCPKTKVDCPFKDHGCLVQFERQNIDQHVQGNMATHMLFLAKKCSLLTSENEHLKDELNQVKDEREQIFNLSQQNAQLQDDMKKLKDDVSSYIWRIEDYPSQSRRLAAGSSFRSPTFWLCGYSWYLRVFPKGDDDSNGFLSMNLVMNTAEGGSKQLISGGVIVSYSVSLISHRYYTDDLTSGEKESIFKPESLNRRVSFMITEEGVIETYCHGMNQSLTIRCTIHVCAALPNLF